MPKVVRVKNISGAEMTLVGQTIADGEYYDIASTEQAIWADNIEVFDAVACNHVVVNKGADDVDDIADPIMGWQWIVGDRLPLSDLDDRKLAVHPSYKPIIPESDTYAVWTGAGDDVDSNPSQLGEGPLLQFQTAQGTPLITRDIKFDHDAFGRVWIHEAYLKFEGGGIGDYISSDVMAGATQLQTMANLDLELDGDYVKFAAGGPGTGTHGFAATPVLLPRSYSKDGDWDYDGTNLTPNMTGTGEYKISTVETIVHRYVNKIPCFGDCPTYFSMSSDETAEIPPGYFLRVYVHNNSDTAWNASVIMEIYRQRTINP